MKEAFVLVNVCLRHSYYINGYRPHGEIGYLGGKTKVLCSFENCLKPARMFGYIKVNGSD